MLTTLTAACAWLDRNALAVAWVALAAGVTVLVARALPRPERSALDAESEPDPADFDAHPDAEELGALFAGALAEYGVTAETSDDN